MGRCLDDDRVPVRDRGSGRRPFHSGCGRPGAVPRPFRSRDLPIDREWPAGWTREAWVSDDMAGLTRALRNDYARHVTLPPMSPAGAHPSNVDPHTHVEPNRATTPADPRSRRVLAWLAVAVLGATAVVGSNAFSLRDRVLGSAVPDLAPPVPGRVAGRAAPPTGPASPTALRSQPWWQSVGSFEGTGPMALPVAVDATAIQWRVTWSCESGHLLVEGGGGRDPIVDADCSESEPGYGTGTGRIELRIRAEGPWAIEVAQQIDAPLVEPPMPAMIAPGATVVARGSVYGIDRSGTGSVIIYREADGGHSIRLEDFFVTPNVDLELRLSLLASPQDSESVDSAPSELVTVMDVTAGSLNYAVPDTVDPTRFRSVVIWCEPIVSAYAAAGLERA